MPMAWSRSSAAEPSSCWFVKMTQWLGDPGGPRCMHMSRWICEYHLSSTRGSPVLTTLRTGWADGKTSGGTASWPLLHTRLIPALFFSSVFFLHLHGGPGYPGHRPHSALAPSGNQRSQKLRSRLPASPCPPAGIPVADLVPEGDLSRVPPGDPCRQEPLHVAQEHDPIHSVVFAVCLLVETETLGEPGPSTWGSVQS